MSRTADFRRRAGRFPGSDIKRMSVDRAGEPAVSTRSGHAAVGPKVAIPVAVPGRCGEVKRECDSRLVK